MSRWFLALLLVLICIVAAVLPLVGFLFGRSSGSEASPGVDLPFHVRAESYSEGNESGFVSGEVLIKFGLGVSDSHIAGLRVGHGAEEAYVSPFSGVRTWRVPASKSVEEWVDLFSKNPLVEYAEPNFVRYASAYPNDPGYQYQWHFDDDHTRNPGGASSNPYGGVNGGGIGMEQVWPALNGSSSVVVAVVDTGIAYENYTIPPSEERTVKRGVTVYQKAPDLAAVSFWVNVDEVPANGLDDDGNGFVDDLNGWDFVYGDAHPNDNNGHGTHVAGTIAQATDNGLGVAGVAFGTLLMPVKVLDNTGGGTDAGVADGIYYAVNNGAKIISMSLGASAPSTTLQNAVAYAYGHGVVVVAASGNAGTGSIDYPAAYDDYVIAVGATRYDETRSYYSNFGASLDLVAPGGDVNVDQNGDGFADGVLQQTFNPYVKGPPAVLANTTDWSYWFFQGTSMATPHVSGVAALLLARDPSLSPDEVRNVLQSTAEDKGATGRDNTFGWGLLDAEAALRSVADVHLLLSVEPSRANYVGGESLTLSVAVLNEMNPSFNSSLSLTVTGPGGYYFYDFQPIAVAADGVKDYGFSWVVPNAAGTYVVEVGLVPAQLTGYDAAWLKVT